MAHLNLNIRDSYSLTVGQLLLLGKTLFRKMIYIVVLSVKRVKVKKPLRRCSDDTNDRIIGLISVKSGSVCHPSREWAGFRTGCECTDQIFTFRQLLEHHFASWYCLWSNGVSEKFSWGSEKCLSPQKAEPLCARLDFRLTSRFFTLDCLHWTTRSLAFILSLGLQNVLPSPVDYVVELLCWNRIFELEYVGDVDLVNDATKATQHILNRLENEASRYEICIPSSECKVLLRNLHGPVSVLTVYGEQP